MPHHFVLPCGHLEPSESRPQITIQRRGTLAINSAAFEALSSPAAVELMFDADRQIVGLRASAATAVNAYPVQGLGKPPHRYLIAGAAFTKYHGIATDIGRSWYANLQDAILCIDLTTAGIELSRDQRARNSVAGDSVFHGRRGTHR